MREVKPEEADFKIPEELIPTSFEKIPEYREIIGQEEALKALEVGLKIKKKGFNIFVAGQPGTGRTSAVKSYLLNIASKLPPPQDLCFVNNFQDTYSPLAIFVKTGRGKVLRDLMEEAINNLVSFVQNIKDSDELKRIFNKHQEEYNRQHSRIIKEIEEVAGKMGFSIQPSHQGLAIIPIKDGKPIPPEEFAGLPKEEKERIAKEREKLEAVLEKISRQKSTLDREFSKKLKSAKENVVSARWEQEFSRIVEEFSDNPEVLKYLKEARKNFLSRIDEIEKATEEDLKNIKKQYSINLAVDNSELKGVPVVIENNPTYKNLIGAIEREPIYGTYTTDFTMIKVGSLIKANGGFLIIHADDLVNPLVWRSLKKSLITETVQIEDLETLLNPISVKSLKPKPVPVNVKVILIGSYSHYSLFYNLDVEFREIFRIKAEFDWTMDLNRENVEHTASFFKKYCKENELLPLSREGFQELLRFSSRVAGERDKISTNFGLMIEIISEADFYAREKGRGKITVEDIKRSIESRMDRASLFKKKDREMFSKGIIKVETAGKKVGQINGLTYIKIDGLSFGRPIKITATVGPGKEGIVDIEKEAALSGPIHTKGVLILNGLLVNEFAKDFPLTLSGRLVFEQSYSEIDGDSASAAEFIALISAISGIAIKQNYAVTGSLNQKGEIQPIGGVNEKIEGFFDICKIRGLKDNGVVIPEDNIEDLNLKDEVLDEIKRGNFRIIAVKHVQELAEFLMETDYSEIHKKVKSTLRKFYSISQSE